MKPKDFCGNFCNDRSRAPHSFEYLQLGASELSLANFLMWCQKWSRKIDMQSDSRNWKAAREIAAEANERRLHLRLAEVEPTSSATVRREMKTGSRLD